jgi:hypothetical protein
VLFAVFDFAGTCKALNGVCHFNWED